MRHIDLESKYIVFQYIKEEEKHNKTRKIPMMLKYLCLQFYLIQECFNDYPKSQLIMKNTSDKKNCLIVYGNSNTININDTSIIQYKWTFKLLSLPTALDVDRGVAISIQLGLISTKLYTPPPIPIAYLDKEELTYLYPLGIIRFNNDNTSYHFGVSQKKQYPINKATNDKIEIVLDLQRKELGFNINNDGDFIYSNKNVSSWKKDTKWIEEMGFRLGIMIPFGAQIELVSFNCQHK